MHEDEKSLLHKVAVHRGGASLPSLVALGASDGLDEATVTYLLGVLVDKSILSVSFPAEGARYDVLETVREYALERLAETGRLAAARRAHAEYFATLVEEAREQLRGRDWRTWVDRLELEHDNLWAALTYARDAGDSGIAARFASLAWYFTLADRVTEGRRFARARACRGIRGSSRSLERLELSPFSASWRPKSSTSTQRSRSASGARGRSHRGGTAGARPGRGDARARGRQSRQRRAGGRTRGTRRARRSTQAKTIGRSQRPAFSRAQVAAAAGDVSTVAAMAADAHRHAEASGFDAFRVPAMLLDAWVAERRNDGDAATDAYGRALELADRTGFADHAAFALSGLASGALASGDLARAEELERRALATAEAARAAWAAAHARVELGRILAMAGDTDTADRLYRNVLAWSELPRQHGPRESLFVALAEDPGAAAAAGLAALGDGHAAPAALVAPA